MKEITVVACVLAVFGATLLRAAADRHATHPVTQTQSAAQTCTLKVSGMTCASCDVAVRIAARTLSGVKVVSVDYPKGRAEVTYDPSKTNPQAIADAITKRSGFKTEPVQKSTKK